jgi:hypothetical protein
MYTDCRSKHQREVITSHQGSGGLLTPFETGLEVKKDLEKYEKHHLSRTWDTGNSFNLITFVIHSLIYVFVQ